MTTMLDVSIRAGVSKATVSRVLNGTGQVKESTRQQVFNAMEELGYRPNFLARSLANRTSNSIGPFDGFWLQQASRQTEVWGKQLIVADGHDEPEREKQSVKPSPKTKHWNVNLISIAPLLKDVMNVVTKSNSPNPI